MEQRPNELNELLRQLISWIENANWTALKRRQGLAGIHGAVLEHYHPGILQNQVAAFGIRHQRTGWGAPQWKRLCEQLSAEGGGERTQALIRLITALQPYIGQPRLPQEHLRSVVELLIITEIAWHEAAHVLMALQLGYSARVTWQGPAWAIEGSHVEVSTRAPAAHLAMIGLAPSRIEIGAESGRRSQPDPHDMRVVRSSMPAIAASPEKQQSWQIGALRTQLAWAQHNQGVADQIATLLMKHMDRPLEVSPDQVPYEWLEHSSALREAAARSVRSGW